jgi:ribosome production factor 2
MVPPFTVDFRLGRVRPADESTWKEAMRRARTTEERPKKNISTASMGDKLGRLHLGRQDLSTLQSRKMKGLKRSRADKDGLEGQADDAMSAEKKQRRGGTGEVAVE